MPKMPIVKSHKRNKHGKLLVVLRQWGVMAAAVCFLTLSFILRGADHSSLLPMDTASLLANLTTTSSSSGSDAASNNKDAAVVKPPSYTYLDAEFRRPGALLDQNPTAPRYPRSVLLYILVKADTYQLKKVTEMSTALKDNFVVIWGNTREGQTECPANITAVANCVDHWILSEQVRRLTIGACCGHAKAVAWSVVNRYALDYVWIMEEDVHYTDLTELTKLVDNQPSPTTPMDNNPLFQPDADLVTQMKLVELVKNDRIGWDKKDRTRFEFVHTLNWLTDEQVDEFMTFSMLNLFRVSRKFLTHLEMVFHDSGNVYGFFESFFPTLARRYNLTIDTYPVPRAKNGYQAMAGRCWKKFQKPGLYHPAKWVEGVGFKDCKGPHIQKKNV